MLGSSSKTSLVFLTAAMCVLGTFVVDSSNWEVFSTTSLPSSSSDQSTRTYQQYNIVIVKNREKHSVTTVDKVT